MKGEHMARSSYQKGRTEQRLRKPGRVYVERYRKRQGYRWIEKTEELLNARGEPCRVPRGASNDFVTKEAQKAADALMHQVNAFNNGAPVSTVGSRRPITMADFVGGLWQHHMSKVKASTAYHYDSLMKLYLLPAFGSKA